MIDSRQLPTFKKIEIPSLALSIYSTSGIFLMYWFYVQGKISGIPILKFISSLIVILYGLIMCMVLFMMASRDPASNHFSSNIQTMLLITVFLIFALICVSCVVISYSIQDNKSQSILDIIGLIIWTLFFYYSIIKLQRRINNSPMVNSVTTQR